METLYHQGITKTKTGVKATVKGIFPAKKYMASDYERV